MELTAVWSENNEPAGRSGFAAGLPRRGSGVPRSAATRPLVVALHGYGADEQDLVRLQRHLGEVDLVSLRAPFPQGNGYCWFPIAVPGVPDVAAVDAAAAAVLAWIEQAIDPARTVVLLGFSQGGTTALQAARHRPDRIRAVVVLSGFVAGGECPGDAEVAALPVFWGRDVEDPVIAAAAIDRTTAFLRDRSTATIRTYPSIGHGIGRAELADVKDFLTAALS